MLLAIGKAITVVKVAYTRCRRRLNSDQLSLFVTKTSHPCTNQVDLTSTNSYHIHMPFFKRKVEPRFVVGYVRVSTDQQASEGVSLAAQRDAIETYCKRNALTLVDVFEDVESGAVSDREGLAGALACLSLGVVGGLVVVRMDRISRDAVFTGTILSRHFGEKSKCVLHCVDTGEVNTRTAAGDFMANITAAVNQYERKVIGERTKQALERVKREGGKMGKAPLGYKYGEQKDQYGRRMLVEDAEAMKVVQAVKEARKQGLSYRKIAAQLQMHPTQVARVLAR